MPINWKAEYMLRSDSYIYIVLNEDLSSVLNSIHSDSLRLTMVQLTPGLTVGLCSDKPIISQKCTFDLTAFSIYDELIGM